MQEAMLTPEHVKAISGFFQYNYDRGFPRQDDGVKLLNCYPMHKKCFCIGLKQNYMGP